jgi:Na+/melibiose symporter-like transporter
MKLKKAKRLSVLLSILSLWLLISLIYVGNNDTKNAGMLTIMGVICWGSMIICFLIYHNIKEYMAEKFPDKVKPKRKVR